MKQHMTYCFRSIVFTNGDILHNLQLPRQSPTHKTMGIRKQCEESDILALETPGAFMLQQGYKAIRISGEVYTNVQGQIDEIIEPKKNF
ncbi:GMP synthase-like protein [Daphnia magna]|uniref:GMP synthase-like protein n=1 Tax=Daphnia magna TaxID=35525 RepID=A0A164GP89_9CRUS|nr:GMP synthase-like protein [Daphnia magna]